MKMIKESAFDSNDKQYPPRQAAAGWKQLAYVHQQEGESLVQYYNRFAKVVEHVERLYGMIAPSAYGG
jgi:broad specificity phosphatase PhoE